MNTVSDILIKALENLGGSHFSRFKHKLCWRGDIPRQRLEEATVEETVTMLVDTYTRSNCGLIVLNILRDMSLIQPALDLETELRCVKFDGAGFSGWTGGASFSREDSASHSCSLQPFSLDTPIHKTGDQLRIVLVGKTGAGKSSTGNTILGGGRHFHAEFSPESVTATCERKCGEACGRSLAVVDTPDFFDTKLSSLEMKREIEKCVEMSVPGPHVFLLVISLLGRFTEEEKNTVKWIKENFGTGASRYTIVLFTGGDRLIEPIEHFVSRSAALKDLVQSCQHRYHMFNNERVDSNQVAALLEKIESMVRGNGGRYYTNAMYQDAQRKMMEEEEAQKRRIQKEEKEKARLQDRIKSTENWKNFFTFTKDLGMHYVRQAEENGMGEGAEMIGGLFGLVDFVVEDCKNDIEKLTRKRSELGENK